MESLVRLVCCTVFLLGGYMVTVECVNICESENQVSLEEIIFLD